MYVVEGFCSYEVTTSEDGDYEWTETVGNTKQTRPCLNTTQGNATRNCLIGGLWTPVDLVECVIREFIFLYGSSEYVCHNNEPVSLERIEPLGNVSMFQYVCDLI